MKTRRRQLQEATTLTADSSRGLRRSKRRRSAIMKTELSERTLQQKRVMIDLTSNACPSWNQISDSQLKSKAKNLSYSLTKLKHSKRRALIDAFQGLTQEEMDIADEVLQASRRVKRTKLVEQEKIWQGFLHEVNIHITLSYDDNGCAVVVAHDSSCYCVCCSQCTSVNSKRMWSPI